MDREETGERREQFRERGKLNGRNPDDDNDDDDDDDDDDNDDDDDDD